MRRSLFTIFFILSFIGYAGAQSAICESYAILNINGAGNTYYDMQAATANPDLNGANLGNFNIGSNTLILSGAQNRVYKCGSDNIFQSYFYYRIYKTTAIAPAFTSSVIFFQSNTGTCNPCGGTPQTWESSGANINVLNGLLPGTYYLEMYTNADYTYASGSGTHYSNNSGANYKATFTVTPVYVTSSGGTSPSTYPTLKTAFDSVNNGRHTGTIAISIYGNTTETATASLNASGSGAASYTSLSVQPAGGAAITVSGNIAGALVALNGADNVTIDGLNNGGNALTFSNTNTGTTVSTISLLADATSNIIQNCTVEGSGVPMSGTAYGTIYLDGGVTTGNDNNTITGNTIKPAGANLHQFAVSAQGASEAIKIDNLTISNNNVQDYFYNNYISAGISVAFTGYSVITGNRIYQTASRNGFNNYTHYGIYTRNGGGNSISNNTVGYASAAGTGTMSYTGTVRMVGIYLTNQSSSTYDSVNGNIITAISVNSTSVISDPGAFVGILAFTTYANIGTAAANIIGAASGTGAIQLTALTDCHGIYNNGFNPTSIQNNIVSSITLNNGSVSGAYFYAIRQNNPVISITNNTIGGSTADAIRLGTLGTTTGGSAVYGIYSYYSAGNGTGTITGNTINNLSCYSTFGTVAGIYHLEDGVVTSNTISNLKSNYNTNSSVNCTGIYFFFASAASSTISQNVISGLSSINNTALFGTNVAGMELTLTQGNVYQNKIFGLSNAGTSTSSTDPPIAAGIRVNNNTSSSIYNNMISLGNGQSTNTSFIGIWNRTPSGSLSVYHNSINIEGSVTSGAQPSFGYLRGRFDATSVTSTNNITDNILANSRSGGTGTHYAIGDNYGFGTSSSTGWTSNYNILNAPNASAVGWWTGNRTFAGWQSNAASDANSYTAATVPFVNTVNGDLHMTTGIATPVQSGGVFIASVATDFDLQVRSTTNPDIGADEYDGMLDAGITNITFTGTCVTSATSFSAVLKNFGTTTLTSAIINWSINGVPQTPVNWSGSLATGSSVSVLLGSATINPALGAVSIVATVSNPNSGTDEGVGNNTYTLSSFPGLALSGTYTVGTGMNFTTINAAVTYININGICGPVIFNVTAGHTETAPAGGIILTCTGTAVNTITFQRSGLGANPVINAQTGTVNMTVGSTAVDGIFSLVGADYVTIDGIDLTDVNSASATVMMEYGYGLFKASASDGSQNNTIKNCTITLRVANQNVGPTPFENGSRGIYMGNVTRTAINTDLTISTATGRNSGNTFSKNTITNTLTGILIRGYADAISPYTYLDQDNTIGGSVAGSGNTITNFGGSTIGYGVRTMNQNNLLIQYNSFDNMASGGSLSLNIFYGINVSASNTTTNANISIRNNTITLAGSSSLYPLILQNNGGTGTSTIADNTITGCSISLLGAALFQAITNTSSICKKLFITGNTITNNSIFTNNNYICIYNASGITDSIGITGNTISNNTQSGNSGGNFYGVINSGAAATTIVNINQNVVSGNSFTGTVSGGFIAITSNTSSPHPLSLSMSNNRISENTLSGTGDLNCIWSSGVPGSLNTSTDTIYSNQKTGASGAIYGIRLSSSAVTATNNLIYSNSIPSTSGASAAIVFGIAMNALTTPTSELYSNNIIYGLSVGGTSTSISHAVHGILSTPSSSGIKTFSQNIIHDLTVNTSGSGIVSGINNSIASAGSSMYRNQVYNLTCSGVSSSVSGILVASGSFYIYNNMVSGLSAPTASGTSPVNGINISNGTSISLIHNSVYLNAASSATTFGSSGFFVSSTPTVDMRNNIIVNISSPGSTSGNTVAYRRTSTNLTNYSAVSNNNLFYAGAAAANRLIFFDGVNSDQTIAAYKTRVGPTRDNASISALVSFLNAAGNDLHLKIPDDICIVGDKGIAVTVPVLVNTDYDTDARSSSTPSIGADEASYQNIYSVPVGSCAATPTITAVSCGVLSGGSSWAYFIDPATKKIIAAINPNGSNLGTVTVKLYNIDGSFSALQSYTDHYGFNWNYLNKIWSITSSIAPVPGSEPSVRFYYTPAEFTGFINANGCTCTDTDLVLLQASGLSEDCDATNNGVASTYNFYWYKNPANYFLEKMHIKDYGTDISVPLYMNTMNFYGDISSGVGKVVNSSNTEFDGRYFQATVPSFSEFRLFLPPQRLLPVDWNRFTGRRANAYNLLEWATSQERNVIRFEVERSIDGTHFNTIGNVNSFGNSNIIHQYDFRDHTSRPGKNYYRIKAIGTDGHISYSSVVLIVVTGKGLVADINPNPVQQQMNCSIISPLPANANIRVMNVEGKTLQTKPVVLSTGINTISWEMGELAPGTYFLQIETAGMPVQVKKFVKL